MEVIYLNNYLNECMPVMIFNTTKNTFFSKIFRMFDENLIGNFILQMTSFIASLCWSVNNHGRLIFRSPSPTLEIITLWNAWLASAMSLQIFPILFCQSFHLISAISFMLHYSRYALNQTNDLFVGARSKATY